MSGDEQFVLNGILFEWNIAKAASNSRKHQVRFAEAATVFVDSHSLLIADPDHSDEETRFILMGMSRMSRILVVVCVERGRNFRIISARKAQKKERSEYEEGKQL